MQRLKFITLALMAAFAISVVTASAASAALPEFGRCVKGAEGSGKYEELNCQKEGGKKEFERKELAKRGFTGTSGAGTFETIKKNKVTCTGDTSKGEVEAGNGHKVTNVTVTFTGCEEPIFKEKCHTAGEAEGTMKTVKLKGELGYLKAPPAPEVGLLLEPAAGTEFLKFECGFFIKSVVEGSVIGKVTPVNVMTPKFKIFYKQKEGKQEFQNFSGGGNHHLTTSINGAAPIESGEETEETVTGEEEAEVFA
jgi:hypothetical protein